MVLQVGMAGTIGVGTGILMAVAGIVLGALFLWLSAAKIFKLKDKSFVTALTISAIAGALGWVLGFIPFLNIVSWLVVIVLTVWLVKTKYKIDWGKAVLVWLVYFALSIVATAIIGLVFVGSMAGLGIMGG